MRRKSERFAGKKSKPSPEKKEKAEKPKRTKTRRRKQSSSSESETHEEPNPVVTSEVVDSKNTEPPQTEKEASPEESQDQVWQVKAAQSSGDVGEIQKLKICLTRPPSTPERVDRSPRSKRKLSRATSSSDTQSIEGEDKKKSKHRSKRGTTEPKDVTEKTDETQATEAEIDEKKDTQTQSIVETDKTNNKTESSTEEVPVSTTDEETKCDKVESTEGEGEKVEEKKDDVKDAEITDTNSANTEVHEKQSDADTTVASPKPDTESDQAENKSPERKSPERKRSLSVEKSEILELHAEESRCETSEVSFNEPQEAKSRTTLDEDNVSMVTGEVSINKNPTEISGQPESVNKDDKVTTDDNNVVEGTTTVEKETTVVPDTNQDATTKTVQKAEFNRENADETKSQSSKIVPNGETAPLITNRKRRWGSRASKFTTQKSITISTDILKEIIPDVKPVEFDEVIEEKKHKRIEVPEKFDRPILPKIVIDNTESIEASKRDQKVEDRDKENVKLKESNLSSARKISIVKENESIIARPPSPPKHKQSNILYITNLVRPFTVSQLKNLLQRTGRIEENGFWMDRIKSKCYVKYETEDQAIETRHALHGVTWPVSNPKTLHVDFATQEDFDKTKANEGNENAQVSTMPGTVEDWLREQDMKREKGELEKPWERKAAMREWDVGKNDKNKDLNRPDKMHRDERPQERRRHRTPERSPEPARKFKKKEEEAPAKLLDDLFRKTKTTPCIYWLPLSSETIAVKEEQRRQHMAEHERRLQELRRTHRRH